MEEIHDDRGSGTGRGQPARAGRTPGRSGSGGQLANPRRVRWTALAQGTLGLVTAGAIAGGALVSTAAPDQDQDDPSASSSVVPVLGRTNLV